jgi:hypothetical protein
VAARARARPAAPTRADLRRALPPDEGFIRGNPDLEPEDAWNYDAGLELELATVGPFSDLKLGATWFRREIDESIVWLLVGPSTIRPVNTGDATADGYELTGSLRLTRFVALSAQHTYVDSRRDANRRRLPGQPEHETFVRLQLGPDPVWKLVGELSHVGEMLVSEGGSRRLPERTVWNASAALNLAEWPDLGLGRSCRSSGSARASTTSATPPCVTPWRFRSPVATRADRSRCAGEAEARHRALRAMRGRVRGPGRRGRWPGRRARADRTELHAARGHVPVRPRAALPGLAPRCARADQLRPGSSRSTSTPSVRSRSRSTTSAPTATGDGEDDASANQPFVGFPLGPVMGEIAALRDDLALVSTSNYEQVLVVDPSAAAPRGVLGRDAR